MELFSTSVAKFLLPAAVLVVLLLRFRRGPLLASALVWPPAGSVALWTGGYLAWMLLTNALIDWRGPFDFQPWQSAPLIGSFFRVLAVCFAGPAMEEVVFRGLLFALFLRTPLGGWGTVAVTAAAWSVLHWNYSISVVFVIFVSGLVLGGARLRTGSLLLPIFMHILWNLFAIW
jgi:membrane protease YdiL (CAAX protease family)